MKKKTKYKNIITNCIFFGTLTGKVHYENLYIKGL